jgi:cytochrome c
MRTSLIYLAAAVVSLSLAGVTQADDKATQALIKKSGCNTCHSLDKKKVGPSYKETAAKYKGDAGAEAKLVTHLTTGPKVMVDGKEQPHDMVKGSAADATAVAQYILSR